MLALAFRAAVERAPPSTTTAECARGAAQALLCGSAFGIYYFVPILCGALVLGWVLSRCGRAALLVALGFFLLSGYLALSGHDPFADLLTPPAGRPFYWRFRSPLRWWGYFLSGWTLAAYWPRAAPGLPAPAPRQFWCNRNVGWALLGVSALTAWALALVSPSRPCAWRGASLSIITYSVIAGFVLIRPTGRAPSWAVTLSQLTYPIYLYHFFFVEALGLIFQLVPFAMPWGLASLLKFVAALAGSLGLAQLARAFLGIRLTRILLG